MPAPRRFLATTALAAIAVAGSLAATEEEGDLHNLEHVYNFEFPTQTSEANAHEQGTDLEFYTVGGRDHAVVGSYDRGAFIFDITDPDQPRFVSQVECRQRQNDVQIKQFGERWVLALARDGSGAPCVATRIFPLQPGAGIALFDITDPANPTPLYSVTTKGGAHNFTFHPTAPVGWVSTGDLPGGRNHIPIIDFSDLEAPRLAADIEVQGGPHDILFNADGTRAYVASENNARIYDTTDPLAPTLISVTTGPASYIHGLDPAPNGEYMILTDESLALGGFFAAGSAVCPGGGFTVYDISGDLERTPVPLSFTVADIQGKSDDHRTCTAHVGRISENSRFYVTGWYLGGVRVFDLADPADPVEIGHAMLPRSEVWAAKMFKGDYVYAADQGRGFDVYRWTGPSFSEDG